MRHLVLAFLVVFTTLDLSAQERPTGPASSAAQYKGRSATIIGKVIEVRRVANGPIIFEIDGVPSAPQFRALVYPMSVERFGSDPEKLYLGKEVEVTGPVIVRKDLPQMWISDPSHIRLHERPATTAE